MYISWIDYSVIQTINWCDSKYNIKSIFFFLEPFLEKIVFDPLVYWYLSFSLDIPGKTNSWIILIFSKIWEEIDGTSSWQHNIRMYRFSDKTYFANGVSINFLFWMPVIFFSLRLFYSLTVSLCNFNLSTSSLLINFIITYDTWLPSISNLQASDSFPLPSKFLAISCLSLDVVNAVYHL